LVLCFDFYLLSSFLNANEQFVQRKQALTNIVKEKAALVSSLIPKYQEHSVKKDEKK